MENLPDDPNVPFKINGVHFLNLEDYKARIKRDAEAMARLLYDIYQDKKQNDSVRE